MTILTASRRWRALGQMAFASAALALSQASHAIDPLGDTSCGQLGQPACTVIVQEWWENGTGTGCDRGLRGEWWWSDWRSHCVNGARESAAVNGWTSHALRLQRELQADLPLNQLTVLGGHNAFNNSTDGYLFPNQQYSITDQLRLGARALALDVHWYNRTMRLCHGQGDHTGCAPLDRPFHLIVEELNQWLRKAENSQEVVFLDMETYTDGHEADLVAPINTYLADLVYRPSMMPAGRLPTLNEIRASGKRLVISGGNDGGSNLFILSFAGWPGWPSSYVKNFVASPCGYNVNGGFSAIDPTYNGVAVRYSVSEDSTVYGPFWNGPAESGVISNDKLRELTACHITGVSLDQITPDKIQHAVWSWDGGEPNNWNNEDCAEMWGNGRWNDAACGNVRRYACRNNANPADWRLSSGSGDWANGVNQCAREFAGYRFDVPRTGYENQKLKTVAQGQSVWLNLSDSAVEGVWASAGQIGKVQLRALGKCLDDSSGQATTGANIHLWDCHGGENQKWILAGDGSIHSAVNYNKCVDLYAFNTNNGGNIVVWDCNGQANQRWVLDGSVIRTGLNGNKVIDVSGGNSANGTNIQIWDYNGSGAQQWTQVRQ